MSAKTVIYMRAYQQSDATPGRTPHGKRMEMMIAAATGSRDFAARERATATATLSVPDPSCAATPTAPGGSRRVTRTTAA